MHLIQKPLSQPPVTAWPNTHLCCEWGSYGTRTTFPLPSSYLQRFSFLADLVSFLESSCLGCVLGSTVWGHLSLAFDLQIQSLAFSIWIFAQFWHHTDMSYQAKRCWGTPFPPKCTCADNCGTSTPNVSLNLWYPTWCTRYGTYSSVHAHLDLFVVAT